jgi:hypothetical protein
MLVRIETTAIAAVSNCVLPLPDADPGVLDIEGIVAIY